MANKTPRLDLDTFDPGDEDWSHTDTVEALDELAIVRGPIGARPDEGQYDGELFYATDQRILWGWDDSVSEWKPRAGLGAENSPLPGVSHHRHIRTGRLDTTSILPHYTDVGEVEPSSVHDALAMRFNRTGWTDPIYRSGPAHPVTADRYFFSGAVLLPDGRVLLVPRYSEEIGLYDYATDTYESGPVHGEDLGGNWDGAFFGAALDQYGRAIIAPRASDHIGIFDPTDDSYLSGAAHEEGNRAFAGAALCADGRIILAPNFSDHVGIYDPATDTYESGPVHGEAEGVEDGAFQGAALVPDGRVIFTPTFSEYVGIFDPTDDSYHRGPDIDVHDWGSYYGSALAPDGRVIFAPRFESRVGIFDPADDSFEFGPDIGEEANHFHGAATSPDGRIVFAPRDSDHVGIFDPTDDSYVEGPLHGEVDKTFAGVCSTPEGGVVFAPRDSEHVGVMNVFTRPSDPLNTLLHPLIQSSV